MVGKAIGGAAEEPKIAFELGTPSREIAHEFVNSWVSFFENSHNMLLRLLSSHPRFADEHKFHGDIDAAIDELLKPKFTQWLGQNVERYVHAKSSIRSQEAIWLTNEMRMIATVMENAGSSGGDSDAETTTDAEVVKSSVEGFMVKVLGGIWNGLKRIGSFIPFNKPAKDHVDHEETLKSCTSFINEAMKLLARGA